MNQKGIAPIAIILIIIGVLAVGGGIYVIKKFQKPVIQACTQEAKQCPDGSYVSRTEPNCEFAACPEKSENILGGDKDEHGCIGSAGYSWCEEKQKCLRTWEEPCDSIDTSDWQTYRNEEYGFEVKYPKRIASYGDFLLEVVDKGDGMFSTFGQYNDVSNLKSHSFDIGIKDAPAEGFIMHIDITSDPLILIYLKDQINRLSSTKTINGINYKTLSYDKNLIGNPNGYIMIRNSQYYIFSVVFDDGVFNQILSTFKFIP